MPTFCRRDDSSEALDLSSLPRTVDSAEAAIEVILTAMHHPERAEIIALVLGADRRGRTIVIVDGTDSPDAVLDVMELLVETAASSDAHFDTSLVLASVRPGGAPLPGDADRWVELDELAETFGCELLDWFVVNDGVAWCPRDVIAEPPRWSSP